MSMPTQSLFLYYDLFVLQLFSILTTVTYFCPPPRLNLSDNMEPKALLCSVLRTTTYQERLLLGAVPPLLLLQLVFVLAVQLPGHLPQHLGVGFMGGLHLQRHPNQRQLRRCQGISPSHSVCVTGGHTEEGTHAPGLGRRHRQQELTGKGIEGRRKGGEQVHRN